MSSLIVIIIIIINNTVFNGKKVKIQKRSKWPKLAHLKGKSMDIVTKIQPFMSMTREAGVAVKSPAGTLIKYR